MWTAMLRPAAGHLARTMPWRPLLAGCGTGAALLTAASFTSTLRQTSSMVTVVRLGFVPVVVGLSFLLREPGRDLATSFPAPGWLAAAARLALAVPVIAATACVQFGLASSASRGAPPGAMAFPGRVPWLALSAELTAWCAVTTAAAALVARSRWDSLGGAVAAPAALALIAALGYWPPHLLPAPTDGAEQLSWQHAHQAWALLVLAGTAAACWASRDRWSRPRVARWR
jgi:hypothetical protein